jgi:DEAD/DEAH box helicase domain-containing protein
MCDARDLGTSVGENAELEVSEEPDPEGGQTGRRTVVRKIFEPNIYLYDSYPGGVGLSEPLFRLSNSLLEKTHKLISECPCPTGCPSCVGPAGEIGEKGKEVALEILRCMVGSDKS